jgi:hypothetical protein
VAGPANLTTLLDARVVQGKDAGMRQSTTLIFGLTFLGFCSGCTMFGNPLARTDPAEAARERQAAEVSALIARGDYEGAQRLMDSLQGNAAPAASSVFDQTHSLRSEADREKMIEQLLAGQPTEWREMLRQKYSQLGTARLEELVAKNNELRGIGQGSVPDPTIPTLVQDPSIQLAGNQQQGGQDGGVTQAQNHQSGQQTPGNSDGFGIGFPQRQNINELHAPDPRPQGTNPSHQSLPGRSLNGEAPRLPDGIDFGVSQVGHLGTGAGSIQPVGGIQNHNASFSTGPGNTGLSGFYGNQQSTGPLAGTPAASIGQLPVISPGNRELYHPNPRSDAATQNPFAQNLIGQSGQSGAIQPTAGYAEPSPALTGGVALENRIEIDSGTISGSATTQSGGGFGNPFPHPGPQAIGSSAAGLNSGFNRGTLPGGHPPTDMGLSSGTESLNGSVAPGQQGYSGEPADQSLIPGVVRGGIESFKNATVTATERGLRTLGAIGDDAVPGSQMAPALAAHGQPETIDSLITRIESELARTAPGDTETERLSHVRKQVNLRMLYLIADRIDQSIEPITGAEPADQEFWQQLFFAYVNYFDAQQMPHASDRATQTIDQLRSAIAKLRHRADLKLKNVTFCHHIVSFGDYERFSTDQFTPGQPLLLYSEVENFFSTRTDTDRYRTVLQSQIEIYDNSNMQRPVVTIPFDPSEDICRNQRRDFFHSYEFTVPQDLQPGLYTLVLRVTDQLSQKVATSRLNFSVE